MKMNKKHSRLLMSVLVALAMFFIPAVTAFAVTPAGFFLKPVMPDNQASNDSNFWNIVLNPGEKQTLYVDVTNETDTELKLLTNVANASTNLNGQVQYTSPTSVGSTIQPQVDYTKYITVDKAITLKPKEVKHVAVQVQMPDKTFTGLATGGVAFYRDPATIKDDSKQKQGFAIQNRYQYVSSLVMRQHTGTTDIIKPNLDLTKVEPAIVNGQTVINSTFVNDQSAYLDNMFTTASIKGKNEYSYTNMQMSMAPNSSFNLPVQTNGTTAKGTVMYQALEAGTYNMHVVVYGKVDDQGQYQNVKTPDGKTRNYRYRWEFNKTFTITAAKAGELNKKNLFKPKANNWWIWLIVAAVALILIGLFIFLFINRKKEVIVQHNESKKYLVQTDDNLAFDGETVDDATVFKNKRKAKQATKNFKNFIIIDYKEAKKAEDK